METRNPKAAAISIVAGLKKAGFQVHSANKGRYVTSSGDTYVVEEDGGLVRRELGSGKKLLD